MSVDNLSAFQQLSDQVKADLYPPVMHMGALKLVSISVPGGRTKLTITTMSMKPFKREVNRRYMETSVVVEWY